MFKKFSAYIILCRYDNNSVNFRKPLDKRATIAILEDGEFNLLIYKRFLSPEFDITICKSDGELYETMKEKSFDLFIMDISLPKSKNGIEILQELRKMEKYRITPIVIVTAHSQKALEDMAMEAGATKFYLKPIENKTLLLHLKALLYKID